MFFVLVVILKVVVVLDVVVINVAVVTLPQPSTTDLPASGYMAPNAVGEAVSPSLAIPFLRERRYIYCLPDICLRS